MEYYGYCGCKMYNGVCTNCHEEEYILDQYEDLDMELPDDDSYFMKKHHENEEDIEKRKN
jgi:hypothetical protein